MKPLVLAADLGGTNLRIAAVDADGTVVHRMRVPTPASRSRVDITAAIGDLALECITFLGSGSRASSLCLDAPAIINAADGSIFSSPNLPDLNGFDLAGALQERLGLPVLLENDAN